MTSPWEMLKAAQARGDQHAMCKTCRLVLPVDSFSADSRYADGHDSECRGCKNQQRAIDRQTQATYARSAAKRAESERGGATDAEVRAVREAAQGSPCPGGCGEPLGPDAHVDHVVPLVDGGGADVANLQAICPRDHAKKTRREAQARRSAGPGT